MAAEKQAPGVPWSCWGWCAISWPPAGTRPPPRPERLLPMPYDCPILIFVRFNREERPFPMDVKKRALKAAFPHTLPIFAGFTFLGVAYGIYMNSLGFSFLYPMFMSITIFAGGAWAWGFPSASPLWRPMEAPSAWRAIPPRGRFSILP